jgi:hypothetical protein
MIERHRSLALGLAIPQVAGMATGFGDCQGRYGHWLAAEGILSVLDMEESPWSMWKASRGEGNTPAHSANESREPALGCAQDPR